MQPQAKVTSAEALDAFRSSLVIYLERARHILDDLEQEVGRVRAWLDQDRPAYWTQQIKRHSQSLAQAEQELLTARLGQNIEAIRDRRRAVDRARARVAEAEGALARVRRWFRQYDTETAPRLRGVRALRSMMDHELVKAIALLADTIRVLAEYAEVAPVHALSREGAAAPLPRSSGSEPDGSDKVHAGGGPV